MIEVEGYEVTHVVYSDQNTHLVRALQKSSGDEHLLHVFSDLQKSDFQAIQHYHLRSRSFSHPSLVHYKGKIESQSEIVLVTDLSRYNCLRRLLEEQTLSIEHFLKFAIQLVNALKVVHDKGYYHGHVHLDSVMVNSHLDNVQWFAYTLQANCLSSPQQQFCQAPEVMNLDLLHGDARSDFYGLGLVFFQMLNGPISSSNNFSFSYFEKSLRNGQGLKGYFSDRVPSVIQELIARLLSYNPMERYQNCNHLLNEIQDIITNPNITSLPAGSHNLPIGLKHPAGIYGRDMEVLEVYKSYQQVLDGNTNFLAISGFSGVGKTSVVDRAQQLYFSEFCLYSKGKFDQISRRIPYSAILQALTGVIDKIVFLPREERNAIAEQIRKSVGDHLGLLIDPLPKLKVLMGVTTSFGNTSTPIFESDYQFKGVLVRLIKCFCLQKRPLVLFLDDVQWADDASVTFLREFLSENTHLPFLMICAYRDNEVKPKSSMSHFLNGMKIGAIESNEINLKPLNDQGLKSLINDVMTLNAQDLTSLLKIVKQKTGSNPFFVLQFLNFLLVKSCISYEKEKFLWQVDFNAVEKLAITENVVDLVSEKISALPRPTINKIKVFACLGNKVLLSDFSRVLNINENELSVQLQPAVNDSIVMIVNESEDLTASNVFYQFSHDRIQQAAYELINSSIIDRLHKRLGERYLSFFHENNLDIYLFSALQHLNVAKRYISDQPTRINLVQLNLLAAKKSKRALAYDEGIVFCHMGEAFLKKGSHPSLEYNLVFTLCECLFLSGQGHKIDSHYQYLIDKAFDESQRALVTLLYIKYWASIGEFKKSLVAGVNVLEKFSVSMLNIDCGLDEINEEYKIQTKRLNLFLENKTVSELIELDVNPNESEWTVIRIFSEIIDCALNAVPHYTRLITINMVNRGIERGHTPYAPLAYVFHGMVMVSLQEDYELAYELGNLAVRLNEVKTKNDAITCKLITAYATDLYHIKNSLVDSPHFYESAYLAGLEQRDHTWCSYSLVNEVRALLSAGAPLNKVLSVMEDREPLLIGLNASAMYDLLMVFKGLVFALQNKGSRNLNFDAFTESGFIEKYQSLSPLIMSWYRFLKIKFSFLLGDYLSHDVLPCIDSINVHEEYIEGAFYQTIIEIKHKDNDIKLNNASSNEDFMSKLEHINGMAKCNPRNFLTYSKLIEAEQSKSKNNTLLTSELYEQASMAARKSGLIYQVALSCQLAGDYLYKQGKYNQAFKYLNKAKTNYNKWGAENISISIGERYPEMDENRLSEEVSEGQQQNLVDYSENPEKFDVPVLEELSVLIEQLSIQNNNGKLTSKMITAFLDSANSKTQELSSIWPKLPSLNKVDGNLED